MNFEQRCLKALETAKIDWRSDVNTKSIRVLNRLARESDESHLYPYISAADKVIRWYSRVYFKANGACSNLEYILGLESQMSNIVNGRG